MFQGHIDLDTATAVEASAIPDVLFERGLYWVGQRSFRRGQSGRRA